MPTLKREGHVFILDLGDGENRVNPAWITEIGDALDEVTATEAPRALVTTATGKFWSNGLDLEWMAAHQSEIPQLVENIHEVYARFFAANVATVAAIQGHAFAAGAMLSLTHDAIVMREDRGYWCVPEVDIRIPFTPGMVSLLQSRLTPAVANEAMTTGRRYSGPQAVEAGFVVAAVAEDQVLATAVDLAEQRAAKDPATLGAIKSLMYARQLEVLRGSQGFEVPGAA